MIDIEGLPLPEGAPAPGACVRIERPEPGLAVVVLDPPHRKLAVLDVPLVRDLDAALDELETTPDLQGVVFTGREPLSFAAGADIDAIRGLTDPALALQLVRGVQGLYDRIEALGERRITTVAAVGGPVPGGACELALACRYIVLADDPRSRIGLPETKLGILPGWGGSQRLPRRVGVPQALDLILKGSLLPPRPALKKGVVDRLTPPEYLVRVAGDIALGRRTCRRFDRGPWRWLVDRNPLALAVIGRQVQRTVARQTGGHYPAAARAARLVTWAPLTPHDRGMQAEAEAIAELGTGAICKNLVGIFDLMEGAKRLGRDADGERSAPIQRGAVLGAGVMGGDIASLMADRGVATRLFDIAPAGLDAAVLRHRADLARRKKRRRLTSAEHDAALDRLDATQHLVGFGRCELVLEAVAERLDVKRRVFTDLAAQVAPDALLATNTSSLSVTAIAEGVPHPERVVGVHFFNPSKKMPLVEIVRGEQTSDEACRRAAAFALQLGKTPVVVADVAGFLVNRLLGPYLDEALRLYDGGVDPHRIEQAARRFGMPMGPLRLLDEVGLDIAAHAATSLHEAYGERMTPSKVIQPLLDVGHLGKKSGDGFYVHLSWTKRPSKDFSSDLRRLCRPRSAQEEFLSDEEVTDRLVLAMLAEGVRALDEGVVASARDLDLATVFGMGFPPFRGGLLRWADTVGAAELVRRLEHCASSVASGPSPERRERFAVPGLLQRMAAEGARFHDAG